MAGKRPAQHDRAGMDTDPHSDRIEMAAPAPFVPAFHLTQYGKGAAQGPEGLNGEGYVVLPHRQDLVAEMIDDGGIMHGSGMTGPPIEVGKKQIGFLGVEGFAMLGIADNIREQGHGGCHLRQSELLPGSAIGPWPLAFLRTVETMLIHG